MINALLICDNTDSSLGDFFDKCANKTKDILSNPSELSIMEIYGNTLNETSVELKTTQLNSDPFIFVSYSHGSETELLKDGAYPYISDNINQNCLTNAFAYCFSCESGKTLGKILCENGTKCFIGYDKIVTIQLFFNAEDSFINCAVSGLNSLIIGRTTGEIFNEMKEHYNTSIDDMYFIDFPSAALLMQNRDALVIHGEKNLKFDDFKIK